MNSGEFSMVQTSRDVSPWRKIARVVLSNGPLHRAQIQEYNEYFDLKMKTEQRTEKFPFAKDATIISIMNRKLEIAAQRASLAYSGFRKNDGSPI